MNRKTLPALAVLGTLAACAGVNSPAARNAASPADFTRQAAEADMTEAAMAQLALERAQSPEVRRFAQRVLDDHATTQSQLQTLARREGISLSQSLTITGQSKVERLAQMDDGAFDRSYMDQALADHQQDYQLFEAARRSGNPEMAELAQNTLPTIRSHLNEAQQADIDVGGSLEAPYELD